jgi:hypothetical protein
MTDPSEKQNTCPYCKLCKINKDENKNIHENTDIKNTLAKMIEKDFAINGKLIMSQLRPNKILITGGIIPAAINKTNDYGDIDIVCGDMESFKYFTDFISSLLNIDPTAYSGEGTLYFGKGYSQKLQDYAKLPSIKTTGDESYCSEKKLGVAKYNHNYCHLPNNKNKELACKFGGLALISHIMGYINKFDLDICKNYFDGETLYCVNINAIKTKRMTLYRYKDKEGQILDPQLDERSVGRSDKYKKRGYKLISEVNEYVE